MSRNPCHSVRTSCNQVTALAKHVSINQEALSTLAKDIMNNYAEYSKNCEWNTDWHYCNKKNPQLTTQYLFVVDALNFCFWPTDDFEYDHLATCIKKVLQANPNALSATNLQQITAETLSHWFEPKKLPNANERALRLREMGDALQSDCKGEAYNLVVECDRSVVCLVRRITELFPGFRDTALLDGQLIHFYKRAQILCGDLWAAMGRGADAIDVFKFTDIEELTMFADYRVPQLLRQKSVLIYDDELARLITAKQQIPFSSQMEVEIRACTVSAVEMLRHELASVYDQKVLAIELDWILWNIGEQSLVSLQPHHRTITLYY